jgi:hypothetical protein
MGPLTCWCMGPLPAFGAAQSWLSRKSAKNSASAASTPMTTRGCPIGSFSE